MDEHPNAALYRRAFESGDFAQAVSDDIEWWEIGSPDPVRGRDALIEHRRQSERTWEITADLHDVVANDAHVVAIIEATARDGFGESISYREAEILHVRNGEFTHRWAFADDTEAIARFFAG
ncbi:MAG TPA: nuclear transport factor 2 family protein [Acidimicrobiia bacterium]